MKKILSTLVAAVLTAAAVPSGFADVLAAWDVNGVDLDDGTHSVPYTLGGVFGSHIESAALTLSGSVNRTTTSGQYGFKISGSDEQTTLENAKSAGHYLQFTLTAAPGYVLNLTSITMNGESAATGADNVALFSDVDGFDAAIVSLSDVAGVTGGFDTDSSGFGGPIDLSGGSYSGLMTVTFRLYGYNTSSGSGATYIRNLSGSDLVINGTVALAPVPEPQEYAVAVAGLLWMVVLMRRRGRRV